MKINLTFHASKIGRKVALASGILKSRGTIEFWETIGAVYLDPLRLRWVRLIWHVNNRTSVLSPVAGLQIHHLSGKFSYNPSLHGKYTGKQCKQWLTLVWGAPKSLQMVTAAMKLKDAYSLEGKL